MFTPQYSWNSVFKLVLNTNQSIINWGDIVQHWNPTRNVLVKKKMIDRTRKTWTIIGLSFTKFVNCIIQDVLSSLDIFKHKTLWGIHSKNMCVSIIFNQQRSIPISFPVQIYPFYVYMPHLHHKYLCHFGRFPSGVFI